MPQVFSDHSEHDVVVIGAGVAGIAAAAELVRAGKDVLVIEARRRLGGRAITEMHEGLALDLGCGWVHNADKNPWTAIASEHGFAIDRTPPPWERQSCAAGLSKSEQQAFSDALEAFDKRADTAAPPDRPAAAFLEPGCRWNVLIDAVSTYFNGAPLDQVSAIDYRNYEDTEHDWRLPAGYGALIARHGSRLPVALDCAASVIDHSGARVRIETARGALLAKRVVVTIPPSLIAAERLRFHPALPGKIDCAQRLPLGVVDKAFLACDQPEMFPEDGHLFGNPHRRDTGSYHLRPFGRAVIEVFVAAALAESLEREGARGTCAFAIEELAGLLGSDVRKHLRGLAVSHWGADPLAMGSYSHAEIGHAAAREMLAEPVEERLFFAGEACAPSAYASAHGAFQSGCAAARRLLGDSRLP